MANMNLSNSNFSSKESVDSVPVIMILFNDDSTEVRYLDGSVLRLKPCASFFTFHGANKPGSGRRGELTRFATKSYQMQLSRALDFRNRFADRPFLCEELISRDDLQCHYANIVDCVWKTDCENVKVDADGCVTLSSEDGSASLLLSRHSLDFSVTYLSKLSGKSIKSSLTSGSLSGCNSSPVQVCHNNNTEYSRLSNILLDQVQSSPVQVCHKCNECKGLPNILSDQVQSSPVKVCHKCNECRELPTILSDQVQLSPVQVCYKSNECRELSNMLSDQVQSSPVRVCHKSNEFGQLPYILSANVHPQPRFMTEVEKIFNISEPSAEYRSVTLNSSTSHKLESQHSASLYQKYTWVTQHCSSQICPPSWKDALGIALAAQKSILKHDRDARRSTFPMPLPSMCPGSHLHEKLNSVTEGHSSFFKVIWCSGVIYRYIPTNSCYFNIEIYPGDGSVLFTDTLDNKIFTHVMNKGRRMYDVEHLPPDSKLFPYSVSTLISTAIKYLNYMSHDISLTNHQPIVCWKYEPVSLNVPIQNAYTVQSECHIPSVGRYRRYANGNLSILFNDRTLIEASMTDRNAEFTSHPTSTTGANLIGQCKLMLPSTDCIFIDSGQSGSYSWYVEQVVEWAKWLHDNKTGDVSEFCPNWNKMKTTEKIKDEIQRINNFNCVAENAIKMYAEGDVDRPLFTEESTNHKGASRALSETTKAIGDIDSFLSSSSLRQSLG